MRAIRIAISALIMTALPAFALASGATPDSAARTNSARGEAHAARRSTAACKPPKPKADDPKAKKKKGGKTTKTAPDKEEGDEASEIDAGGGGAGGSAAGAGGSGGAAPAGPAGGGGKEDEEGRTLQRGERVEFDARLIQGQTAKAGAVYLFARVPTNLKSMVRERTNFHEKIVRTVYPHQEEAP